MKEMLQVALDLNNLETMPEDSGTIYDNGKEIKRVMAGIDMTTAELAIAKHTGFDCVALHHPNGITNPDIGELLGRDHMKKLMECGVPINAAQKLAFARKEKSHQATHSRNRDQFPSMARLLDMNALALHTPADILAEKYAQEKLDGLMQRNPRCTVQDVINELLTIREYKDALPGQQPEVWVGSSSSYAGRIYVEMYGVGAPTLEEYIACSDAGVGTFICMHATPEVIDGMKKHNKSNIIVAGHMASDSLGFNQILKIWEENGVEVVRVCGLI
jgi:putative NIF3 family GTP cyclohydrolase 1 type 2